jgi:hypothetical protein
MASALHSTGHVSVQPWYKHMLSPGRTSREAPVLLFDRFVQDVLW